MKRIITCLAIIITLALYLPCQAAFIVEPDGTSYHNYTALMLPNGTLSEVSPQVINIDLSGANAAGWVYDDANSLIRTTKKLIISPATTQLIGAASDTINPARSYIILDPNHDITLTSAPTIPNGIAGQLLTISLGAADPNTVTVQDQGTLVNSNLQLRSSKRVITKRRSLTLRFNGTDWIEESGPVSSTFLIAAYDAANSTKAVANYICDGTNDEVEIQAAIDSLPTTHEEGGAAQPKTGKIILSEGRFNIGNTISLKGSTSGLSHLELTGQGWNRTVLHLDPNITIPMMKWDGTSDIYFLSVKDMLMYGNRTDPNAAPNSSHGILLDDVNGGSARDFHASGLFIERFSGSGIYTDQTCWGHVIHDVIIEFNNGYGYYCNSDTGLKISHCKFLSNMDHAIYLTGVTKYIISNNEIGTVSGKQGIRLYPAGRGVITGNQFTSNASSGESTYGIYCTGDDNLISGNLFQNLYTGISLTLDAERNVVSNNQLATNLTTSQYLNVYGISCGPYTVCTGNSVEIYRATSGVSYGINVSGWDKRNCTIIGNNVSGKQETSGSIKLINIDPNTNNTLVEGNRLNILAGTVYPITDNGTASKIVNNYGDDETVTTASPTLKHWGISNISSISNDVVATLPDGQYVGEIKTIVLTDATNAADGGTTVSVTHHETSDPEVGTFDAVGEHWILEWTGSDWVTLKASCSF